MRATASLICAGAWFAAVSSLAGMVAAADAGQAERPTVVFVCEKGSVKSLMAASLFNRLAREQGIDVDAVSRGVAPDPAVPPPIERALAGDGFDVRGFKPQQLTKADAAGALQVVALGVDVAPVVRSLATVRRWDAIPPASTDYAKARDALMAEIRKLLDEMARK